jgi:hypothetical protein
MKLKGWGRWRGDVMVLAASDLSVLPGRCDVRETSTGCFKASKLRLGVSGDIEFERKLAPLQNRNSPVGCLAF